MVTPTPPLRTPLTDRSTPKIPTELRRQTVAGDTSSNDGRPRGRSRLRNAHARLRGDSRTRGESRLLTAGARIRSDSNNNRTSTPSSDRTTPENRRQTRSENRRLSRLERRLEKQEARRESRRESRRDPPKIRNQPSTLQTKPPISSSLSRPKPKRLVPITYNDDDISSNINSQNNIQRESDERSDSITMVKNAMMIEYPRDSQDSRDLSSSKDDSSSIQDPSSRLTDDHIESQTELRSESETHSESMSDSRSSASSTSRVRVRKRGLKKHMNHKPGSMNHALTKPPTAARPAPPERNPPPYRMPPSYRLSATSATTTSTTPSQSINISSVESIDEQPIPSITKPPRTIMDVLRPHAVSMQELDSRYHSLLVLVKSLLGVVSNGGGALEMFPPAFTTYNILVPNMLNVPFVLWGIAAPVDLIALASYYAARSSRCAYCSLLTCAFARRRGVDEGALVGARSLSRREAAVVEVALNMSSFPNHLTEEDRKNLFRHLSPSNVEWVVLSVSMVGYLVTFMNGLGTNLERDVVYESGELLKSSGWTEGKHDVSSPENYLQELEGEVPKPDTLLSNLKMVKYMPAAMSYDMNALKKIPKAWPEIGDFLMQNVGHSFPILGLLKQVRAVRAIAEAIRLNLDAIVCGIEPDTKYLVGLVYAGVNRNRLLAKEFRKMIMLMVDYFDEDMINAVHAFSKEETDFTMDFDTAMSNSVLMEAPLSETQVRILYVAKACSYLPTETTEQVVLATKEMRPADVVELLNWVAVLSMLQKLYVFYYPSCTERLVLKHAQLGVRAPQFSEIERVIN